MTCDIKIEFVKRTLDFNDCSYLNYEDKSKFENVQI